MFQKPVEGVENLESYHNVFASSLREVVLALARKDSDQARILIQYNIWYAVSMWMVDEDPKAAPERISAVIEKLDLGKKTLPQLVVIMTVYQSRAGLKPVQERDMRARLFERFLNAEARK